MRRGRPSGAPSSLGDVVIVLMIALLLQRQLQKLLAGLTLPRREAVYRLADKRSCGVVAQLGEIVGELMQLGKSVHRGAADLRTMSLPVLPAITKTAPREREGIHASDGSPAPVRSGA